MRFGAMKLNRETMQTQYEMDIARPAEDVAKRGRGDFRRQVRFWIAAIAVIVILTPRPV